MRTFLPFLLTDHIIEKLTFLICIFLQFGDISIDNKKHHSKENISFLQIKRTKKIALAWKIEKKRWRKGEIPDVCSLVNKKIKVAVCVIFIFWKFYSDYAAILIAVIL